MKAGLAPLDPGPPPVEVFDDLRWVMEGFWRLSNARPQGMNGPVRIPLSEIEAYGRIKSFGYEKRQDFLFYVERLDEKYMEYIAKAMETEKQKHGNKGEPPSKSARPH